MSTEEVRLLTPRVAHATHALLAASGPYAFGSGPLTAAEVCLHDATWEALSPRHTAAALRQAQRQGLAAYVPGGYWIPTGLAHEYASALEARFLRDDDTEQA